MEKNTAGKWIVFAYGLPDHASDGQPITGDAANITANVRIDGGAANATDDVNPTELEDGYYIFDITAAEANGDLILMTPQSATANVQVIGVPGSVWTRPANFNDMSVEASTGRVDIAAVAGTAQTAGDIPALVTTVDGVVDNILLDTAEIGTAGAGLTNIGTIATVTNLTNLPTIPANWLTAAGTAADFTTEIQAGLATPTNITAASGVVLSGVTHTGAVIPTVTTVGTTTTNTDMRGTDSAATATALATAQTDLDTITGADGVNLLSATQASIDAIELDTGTTLQGELDAIQAAVITNATGADVAADIIAMQTQLDDGTNGLTAIRIQAAISATDVPGITTTVGDIQTTVDQLNLGNIYSSAAAGTLTTTSCTTNLGAGYTVDQLIGRSLTFTSGVADGESTVVTDFGVTGATLTYKAIYNAPGVSDNFKLGPSSETVASSKMVFTKANELDVNTKSINDAEVIGDGNATAWDGV